MKSYFAYIRVSTVKQGEQGSSLQEQRAAIDAFAHKSSLSISRWFEETETAAKRGRRQFNKMVVDLERGRAAGVIIHKIDRSARNLKDWASLGELMDRGVEVHFVQDNLDLTTRGGRLAADLQAVVAADYIRNLRDEVKKGFYGRLKQGFYPLPAPRGYLDMGKAKAKEIDPVVGPLVGQAFELYGSGNYGLHQLRLEMARRGLRSSSGTPLSLDAISSLLHNPFYVGLMRIKRTNELFEGNHAPLVTKSLFDRVQAILAGRLYPRTQIHRFRFRRLIKCAKCGRSLSGERQKGSVYYRCHDLGCRSVSLREDRVDEVVRGQLQRLQVDDGDIGDFREVLASFIAQEEAGDDVRTNEIERDLGLVSQRLERLTDALVDGVIDKRAYAERKGGLLAQRATLLERRESSSSTFWLTVAERFELGLTALQGYEIGNDDQKREILKSIGSNLVANGKSPAFPMFSPFNELRNWAEFECGAPRRGAARTSRRRRKLIANFVTFLAQKCAEIQTGENGSKTQAPTWRPDYRPLLPRHKPRGARARPRAAPRPRPPFDTDRQTAC